MGKHRKKANAASIIGGADGPTAVFVCCNGKDKNPIRQLKRSISDWKNEKKRREAARRIEEGAVFHTIEETIAYIRETYQGKEAGEDYHLYEERRKNLRMALLQRRRPDLLEEEPIQPPKDLADEQEVLAWHQKLEEQTREREKRAAAIPEEEFPIEYHLFLIDRGEDGQLEIETELLQGEFSCSYAGKKEVLEPILKDIYWYYGVSKEDIRQKTERYRMLELVLSS